MLVPKRVVFPQINLLVKFFSMFDSKFCFTEWFIRSN